MRSRASPIVNQPPRSISEAGSRLASAIDLGDFRLPARMRWPLNLASIAHQLLWVAVSLGRKGGHNLSARLLYFAKRSITLRSSEAGFFLKLAPCCIQRIFIRGVFSFGNCPRP